ncbi:50S ribosomal protein L34, chloroplastic [Linum perenne]
MDFVLDQPPSRLIATASLSLARNLSIHAAASRSALLHSSSPSSSSFSSSFSGFSLGIGDFNSSDGRSFRRGGGGGAAGRFVVIVGKAVLCSMKRSRSCKSLARTHEFRKRMQTSAVGRLIGRCSALSLTPTAAKRECARIGLLARYCAASSRLLWEMDWG